MKTFLKNLAQGVYDGLQENKDTQNKYTFNDILDVIEEFVAYIFVGLICTVFFLFFKLYFQWQVSIAGFLVLIWSFVVYYFTNSKPFKKIKRK